MTAKPISASSTEEFYDELASSYNDIIYRCAPRYDEMQMTMVDYVPNDLQPLRILDLGCGTGNLTLRVLEAFQEAEVVALREDYFLLLCAMWKNVTSVNEHRLKKKLLHRYLYLTTHNHQQ